MEEYNRRSLFANARWDDAEYTEKMRELTPEAVEQNIFGHIQFILHDEHISKVRKMLLIEQFRNAEMAQLQTRQNYADVMRYFTGLVQFFIDRKVLRPDGADIMAAQLCLPVTVWIGLCDREPECEAEVMELIRRHIRQFFTLYRP